MIGCVSAYFLAALIHKWLAWPLLGIGTIAIIVAGFYSDGILWLALPLVIPAVIAILAGTIVRSLLIQLISSSRK